MKPFLSFPVETTSPVGLFPNFKHGCDGPGAEAVINHTFGVTMVPKKKQVISCNVCQLRFNSDSQAEAHYRGSRHAKKLKSQENKAKAKLSVTAETNGSSSSPAGPAPNSSTYQHTEFLPSISDSSSPLKPSSCPPPPPPLHLPPRPPPAEQEVSLLLQSSLRSPCSRPLVLFFLFLQSFSSSSSCPSSYHLLFMPTPHPPTPSQDTPPSAESEEEKAKKLLYCSLCKVAVNSLSQLEAHNAGEEEMMMMMMMMMMFKAQDDAGGSERRWADQGLPSAGAKLKNGSSSGLKGSGLQNKTFHCQICDVHVNSEIQLKQHISSRRHKDRVAGKPSKPKYSPYNKQQRNSLTKELVKPSLSPSFLSTPFAPPPSSLTSSITLPPASLSSSPLLTPTSSPLTPAISLHPRPPASSSLFTASFLRPAPGPIRASQGSILFTPY
ncbi:hypothetical protein INR49_010191 [Caranx melampygus]|nr:hypothetical protein INR49_010191 [Caranx melampygus]